MSIKAKRFRAQPATRLLSPQGTSGADLGGLIRKAQLIDRAQAHLRHNLPEEIRPHLFVGGYRDGRLTLITDGAHWLTWLRYEQARLLRLIRELPGFEAVLALTLKVRPVSPVKPPPVQHRALPAPAAEELQACARDTRDPQLKRALERLASHARTEDGKPKP
ncbi:DUF721 domain-containing protein [Modicisalibacter tunisiensis]|uniref:DUF721 domain-containing protein n=1 Tax=Modicisalibacter tunisiensis TaxID=390637 RepID=UPI00079C2C09|nr:DciA family protein [Modicisalibacter tunisiensis]KXS38842.1 MAG: hypothetical protein AWU55_1205 [Halomonadaceae bacterium T82-2]MBZ9538438.1 DUF721 domain-containing protein [Modicisalibacter tunisiensis]